MLQATIVCFEMNKTSSSARDIARVEDRAHRFILHKDGFRFSTFLLSTILQAKNRAQVETTKTLIYVRCGRNAYLKPLEDVR
jgi:hypothetical protein